MFFLAFTPAPARQIWVAQSGGDDNTGTGTAGAPFATLVKGLSVAAAYDTVTLRAGIYRGTAVNGGIQIPYLTIQGAPGEEAQLREPWKTTDQVSTVYFNLGAHHGTVRNLHITGGSYYCVKFETDFFNGVMTSSAHHGLIEDCELDSSANDCIKLTPGNDGAVIRRCEIHHSGMSAGSFPNVVNADGLGWYCSQNARAYNNTLIRCGIGTSRDYGVAVRFGLQGTAANGYTPSNLNPWLVNTVVLRSPGVQTDGETIYLRGDERNAANTAVAVNTLHADYNLYWDPALAANVHFANRNDGTNPVFYTSLAEWQNAPSLSGVLSNSHRARSKRAWSR
jgi:hypothetical protein